MYIIPVLDFGKFRQIAEAKVVVPIKNLLVVISVKYIMIVVIF